MSLSFCSFQGYAFLDPFTDSNIAKLSLVEAAAIHSKPSSISSNYPLISAIVAFAIAQSIKFFTTWFKERRWYLKQLVGSGGMPSSHSATVIALAAAIGLQEGFGGPLFATALVMYDATGVRLQAGLQAEVLNQIVYELPAEHPLAESRPLHELLGHTPPQVIVGGILGLLTAIGLLRPVTNN